MNSALFRPPKAENRKQGRRASNTDKRKKLHMIIEDLTNEKNEYVNYSNHLSQTEESVKNDNEKLLQAIQKHQNLYKSLRETLKKYPSIMKKSFRQHHEAKHRYNKYHVQVQGQKDGTCNDNMQKEIRNVLFDLHNIKNDFNDTIQTKQKYESMIQQINQMQDIQNGLAKTNAQLIEELNKYRNEPSLKDILQRIDKKAEKTKQLQSELEKKTLEQNITPTDACNQAGNALNDIDPLVSKLNEILSPNNLSTSKSFNNTTQKSTMISNMCSGLYQSDGQTSLTPGNTLDQINNSKYQSESNLQQMADQPQLKNTRHNNLSSSMRNLRLNTLSTHNNKGRISSVDIFVPFSKKPITKQSYAHQNSLQLLDEMNNTSAQVSEALSEAERRKKKYKDVGSSEFPSDLLGLSDLDNESSHKTPTEVEMRSSHNNSEDESEPSIFDDGPIKMVRDSDGKLKFDNDPQVDKFIAPDGKEIQKENDEYLDENGNLVEIQRDPKGYYFLDDKNTRVDLKPVYNNDGSDSTRLSDGTMRRTEHSSETRPIKSKTIKAHYADSEGSVKEKADEFDSTGTWESNAEKPKEENMSLKTMVVEKIIGEKKIVKDGKPLIRKRRIHKDNDNEPDEALHATHIKKDDKPVVRRRKYPGYEKSDCEYEYFTDDEALHKTKVNKDGKPMIRRRKSLEKNADNEYDYEYFTDDEALHATKVTKDKMPKIRRRKYPNYKDPDCEYEYVTDDEALHASKVNIDGKPMIRRRKSLEKNVDDEYDYEYFTDDEAIHKTHIVKDGKPLNRYRNGQKDEKGEYDYEYSTDDEKLHETKYEDKEGKPMIRRHPIDKYQDDNCEYEYFTDDEALHTKHVEENGKPVIKRRKHPGYKDDNCEYETFTDDEALHATKVKKDNKPMIKRRKYPNYKDPDCEYEYLTDDEALHATKVNIDGKPMIRRRKSQEKNADNEYDYEYFTDDEAIHKTHIVKDGKPLNRFRNGQKDEKGEYDYEYSTDDEALHETKYEDKEGKPMIRRRPIDKYQDDNCEYEYFTDDEALHTKHAEENGKPVIKRRKHPGYKEDNCEYETFTDDEALHATKVTKDKMPKIRRRKYPHYKDPNCEYEYVTDDEALHASKVNIDGKPMIRRRKSLEKNVDDEYDYEYFTDDEAIHKTHIVKDGKPLNRYRNGEKDSDDEYEYSYSTDDEALHTTHYKDGKKPMIRRRKHPGYDKSDCEYEYLTDNEALHAKKVTRKGKPMIKRRKTPKDDHKTKSPEKNSEDEQNAKSPEKNSEVEQNAKTPEKSSEDEYDYEYITDDEAIHKTHVEKDGKPLNRYRNGEKDSDGYYEYEYSTDDEALHVTKFEDEDGKPMIRRRPVDDYKDDDCIYEYSTDDEALHTTKVSKDNKPTIRRRKYPNYKDSDCEYEYFTDEEGLHETSVTIDGKPMIRRRTGRKNDSEYEYDYFTDPENDFVATKRTEVSDSEAKRKKALDEEEDEYEYIYEEEEYADDEDDIYYSDRFYSEEENGSRKLTRKSSFKDTAANEEKEEEDKKQEEFNQNEEDYRHKAFAIPVVETYRNDGDNPFSSIRRRKKKANKSDEEMQAMDNEKKRKNLLDSDPEPNPDPNLSITKLAQDRYGIEVAGGTQAEYVTGSADSKWTRNLIQNAITTQLDRTRLQVEIADKSLQLSAIVDQIIKAKMELKQIQSSQNKGSPQLEIDVFSMTARGGPAEDVVKSSIEVQTDLNMSGLEAQDQEIKNNIQILSHVFINEQQKKVYQFHIPHLQETLRNAEQKSTRLRLMQEDLERRMIIVCPDTGMSAASAATRERIRYEKSIDQRKTMLETIEKQTDECHEQIRKLKARIKDQKCIQDMLKRKTAEGGHIPPPNVKALCRQLDDNREKAADLSEKIEYLKHEEKFTDDGFSKIEKLISDATINDMEEANNRLVMRITQRKVKFDAMRRTDHTTRTIPLTFSDDISAIETRYRDIQNEMVMIQSKENALMTKIKKKIARIQKLGINLLEISLVPPDI